MPRLFVLSGPEIGRTYDVEHGAVLGRGQDCDAPLRGTSISRTHARIAFEDGTWVVSDLGSRNGVWVAGEKVERAVLVDGTEFRLGDVELRIRMQASSAPAAPPPAQPAEDDEDEIVLEDPGEPLPPPPLARREALEQTTLVREPPRAAPAAKPRAAAEPRESALAGTKPPLQYSRQLDTGGGFLGADLGQQPAWVKVTAVLAALALFAAIFYGAFKLTSVVKRKAVGDGGVEQAEDF
jgi:predicted component of type VI protein secretion system